MIYLWGMAKKLKDTASEFEKLGAIKKLNEELTAENARLLEENENLINGVKDASDSYETLLKEKIDFQNQLYKSYNKIVGVENELNSIKSKWWYKLMTWGWK